MTPYTLPDGTRFLLDRAIFQLSGPDAARYLNGQCSQDVSLATEQAAVYAMVTNFKGKLDGDCYIRRRAGSLLIDCPSVLRESLFARLDRYLIADDAELIDVSESFDLVHCLGETSDTPESWTCNRTGQAGYDMLLAKGTDLSVRSTDEEYEKVRISHGIPAWGSELDHDTLPPEAGVEARAISYTKGCYTGQEVISRIRSAGKTNRHLVLATLSTSVPAGSPLLCDGATPEKPAGVLTSVAQIGKTQIALAYRRRKFQDISSFTAADAEVKIN